MQPWDLSCPDWRERILKGETLVPDLPLFETEADRALRVFKRLKMPDVIGTPTMEEACGPWFFPIVRALFGAYDTQNNVRMIREVFQLIPKGNSKSSNGGALMLTALIVNRRPEAEFLLVAPTLEIAGIAFKQAKGTIKLDPELDKLFQIQDHIKKVTHRRSGASLQIKAADTDVITGSKATGTMIDETHVFAKRSNASDVFVELRGALTKRPEGFLYQTTTQSKAPPAGVFKAELDMARAVRDGRMKLPILPVLYELPEEVAKDGGWKDRKYWPLVNPNLGRSTNEAFLAGELMKADQAGAAQMALLASQHFNVEIGVGLSTDNWAGGEFWEQCADKSLTLDALLERSEVVVVGVDGGGLDDMLGLCVLGRENVTGRWLVWCRAWAHRIVLERRKEVAPRLLDFEKEGTLTIVDVPGQDVDEVAAIVRKIEDSGLLAEKPSVAVDAAGIGDIVDALTTGEQPLDVERIIGIQQGWKLTGSIKTTERKLAGKEIVHDGSALMAWCVGNAKIEPRGNAITITKQTAGSAKIDPLMGVFDAVSLMATNPEARNATKPEVIFL